MGHFSAHTASVYIQRSNSSLQRFLRQAIPTVSLSLLNRATALRPPSGCFRAQGRE